jgi:putative MFS transporter
MTLPALNGNKTIASPPGQLALPRLLVRARLAMGFATFFDGFDVLAIAYVLPVIAPAWHLSNGQIGALISSGFAGQLLGAFLFGRLAERYGRVPIALSTILLFSIASLGCAVAWGFLPLLLMRFVQGIGLGGEMPVAAAYISELSPTKGRGRFFMLYELIFPAGLVGAGVAGYLMVPALGWQSMFLLGAAPAPLLFILRRGLPESPRWLQSVGRHAEAADVLARLNATDATTLANRSHQSSGNARPHEYQHGTEWKELFKASYGKRTLVVWCLWISAYFVTYGLTSWLPTLYRNHFHLPLGQALGFSLITGVAGFVGAALCALLVDRSGRKPWFIGAFVLGTLGLIALSLTSLTDAASTQALVSISYVFISANATLLYLYTPEIYPTRVRALGVGVATAWLRIASMTAPLIVPMVLTAFGIRGVVQLFAGVAALGVLAAFFTTETAGRTLEEISP